jgi:type IV pilus assembly protein PilQ
MENKELGNVLASPQVTVLNNQEGNIQVGSDYSVTTKDFAGNTITQFFSTGSIIKVTPEILKFDTLTFIRLKLDVQRSSANTSELGTEIKKTSAQTQVLLLDGEETIIGGLYTYDEDHTRGGVPILRELPWWFLGLRYIFSYEYKTYTKKELIIVLRADLLPPLAERIKSKTVRPFDRKALEEMLKKRNQELETKEKEELNSKKR